MRVTQQVTQFPILTFGEQFLHKTGNFNENGLNSAFQTPINLAGKSPTLSYYPFFSEDSNAYVAPYIIRALVEIGIKKSHMANSPTEFVVSYTEVVESIFSSVWETMSDRIRRELGQKVENVVNYILTKPKMKEALEAIEARKGIRVLRPLARLQTLSEEFISEIEKESTLDRFLEKV